MSSDGISYDNIFVSTLNRLGDIMLLSVLFTLFSLPVFTIGASTTALYYTAMKGIKLDGGYVFKYFIRSFRDNFKKSSAIWLICMLAFVVFGVDTWFWAKQFTAGGLTVANVLLVLSIILLTLTFFITLYVFPLQAKFENTIRVQIRNAFLLSIKYFPTTLMLTAIAAVVVWCFYYQPAIAIVGFFMVGFGIIGYVAAYFMLRCFKPYLPEESGEDEAEWTLEDEAEDEAGDETAEDEAGDETEDKTGDEAWDETAEDK